MRERRSSCPNAGDARGANFRGPQPSPPPDPHPLDVADDGPRTFVVIRDDRSPRVDQHRMSLGAASARMFAALRGREEVAWFSTARARSSVSQCAAPVVGKCRGNDDHSRLAQRPVELGEAQVVADRQADPAARRVDRDRRAPGSIVRASS